MPEDNQYWGSPTPAEPTGTPAYTAQPTYTSVETPAYAPTPTAAPAYTAAPATAPAGAAAYAPAPEKKSHGWIVAIVVVVCFFALMMFGISSCNAALENSFSTGGRGGALAELTGDAIGVIELSGTIQYDGSACSPEGLKELLDDAEDDDRIKAVVLRVDSGGGTATAGEEMAYYVSQFSKPIVVSSASLNASAAYEISSQADYIYVAKSTEIGAIGTVMQLTDLSGLLEKLGVNMDTITSADSKDSSYGYRSLTDEERAYYQDMVDQINSVFIENVAAGRDMSIADVEKLATGMPFTGMDAVKNGLADEIGTREDALDKAAELAGIEEYEVVDLRFGSYDILSLYDLLSMKNSDELDQLLELLKEQGNDVKFH